MIKITFFKSVPPLTIAYFAFWIFYFSLFWSRSLHFDLAGNLVAGNVNMWADWAIHFTIGSTMVYRDLVPVISPLLLGDTFSYPFAVDLVSALLAKSGVDFFDAFVVPSYLASLMLVAALFYFIRTLFQSDTIAVLGSCIFLLAGGSGFFYFINDVFSSPAPLDVLLNPPHEYTRIRETPIVLLSVIDSAVIPQRSFTLGFPLALFALGVIFACFRDTVQTGFGRAHWVKLVVAALILGLMPLIHTHSFLAAFIVLSFWSICDIFFVRQGPLIKRAIPWLVVAATTTLVALPLLAIFIFGRVSEGFIRWYPGWYAREMSINWVWFWLSNWSLTPLLAVIGLMLLFQRRDLSPRRRVLLFNFLPFFFIFALLNLFLFQPWIWDNTKLLAWASVGFSGLAAYAVVRLWSSQAAWLRTRWVSGIGHILSGRAPRFAAGVVLVGITASGAIDAYRVLRVDLHSHVMYTPDDFRMAEWVKKNTAPDTIWLTGDRHNHWLFNLTGRQTLMAYRGWLWSQGYDYREIERDIGQIYATADPALFARYRLDYVVIGPDERTSWRANEPAFVERFPVVKKTDLYTIVKVGNHRAPANGQRP